MLLSKANKGRSTQEVESTMNNFSRPKKATERKRHGRKRLKGINQKNLVIWPLPGLQGQSIC